MAKKPRGKNKDNARRSKKKVSILTQEKVDYVDYKDINLLRRFMSDRAKVRARRVTGNSEQQQKEVARAIKNAREMALLPYTNRVTTQRTSKDRERGGRADAPPPRPTADTPPPTREEGEEGYEGDTMADADAGAVEAGVAEEAATVEEGAVEAATVEEGAVEADPGEAEPRSEEE